MTAMKWQAFIINFNKAMLTSNRAAIDRTHIRNKQNNGPFSVIVKSEFAEANKALNSLLESLNRSGEICSMVHKRLFTMKYLLFVAHSWAHSVDCMWILCHLHFNFHFK